MYKIAPKTPLACQPHDHSQCVSTALAEADALCARQGVRLTELRRRVLELVWQSHKPLGAYDILAVLSETDGRRAAGNRAFSEYRENERYSLPGTRSGSGRGKYSD